MLTLMFVFKELSGKVVEGKVRGGLRNSTKTHNFWCSGQISNLDPKETTEASRVTSKDSDTEVKA
jgi:hypothetical protein